MAHGTSTNNQLHFHTLSLIVLRLCLQSPDVFRSWRCSDVSNCSGINVWEDIAPSHKISTLLRLHPPHPPLPPPRPRMSCLNLFRQSLLIKQEIAGGFCSVRGSSSLFGGLDPIIAAMGRRLGLTFKWAKASFWQAGGKSMEAAGIRGADPCQPQE